MRENEASLVGLLISCESTYMPMYRSWFRKLILQNNTHSISTIDFNKGARGMSVVAPYANGF